MRLDADHGSTNAIALVVIDREPDALRPLLTPSTIRRTHIVSAEAARCGTVVPSLAVGVALPEARVDAWTFVHLPVDGPVEALESALRGLGQWLGRRCATAVVLAAPDGGLPPAPAVLRLFPKAGLIPGVDLSHFDWVPAQGVWITRPTQLMDLPLKVGTSRGSRHLGQLLLELEVFMAGSPTAGWAAAVAAGCVTATRDQWDTALRADYVEHCVAALRATAQTATQPSTPAPTSR